MAFPTVKTSKLTYEQRYSLGKKAETDRKSIVDAICGVSLTPTPERFAPWDFESATVVAELKTRTNSSRDYDTTLIDYIKIERALQEKRDVYFCFNFTDCVMYCKFSKERFEKYRTHTFALVCETDSGHEMGNREVSKADPSLKRLVKRVYIPISHLSLAGGERCRPQQIRCLLRND